MLLKEIALREAGVKDHLEDQIRGVVDRLPLALVSRSYDEVVKAIASKVKEKLVVDDDILDGMIRAEYSPDDHARDLGA